MARTRIALMGAGFIADIHMESYHRFVPDAEVEKRAVDMAKQIAELPPLAIEQAKEAVLRGLDASLETGLALEAKAIQLLFSSQDQKEGMAAFIEKRKPRFTGR